MGTRASSLLETLGRGEGEEGGIKEGGERFSISTRPKRGHSGCWDGFACSLGANDDIGEPLEKLFVVLCVPTSA